MFFLIFKHHCRRCGNIFCSNCSDRVATLEDSGNKPVRICECCWDKLQSHASSMS